MKPIHFSRTGIALLALTLFTALPAAADIQFRVRKMTRNDVPLGKGQCDIRLQVDDQVEVTVRRDMVSVRKLSGQEARDDGSECNAPFPDRDLQDFHFEVIDHRNEIRLVDEPSRRNDFTTLVAIRDSASGFGRYHFRLSWAMTALSEAPRREGPPDFPRGDGDRRPGDGFVWNNATHFGGPGRGGSTVDIDRGGRIQVSFRTDTGRPITFSGTVIARDGDTLKADVVADDRMLRLRGPMYLTLRGREDIDRIALDATNGQDTLRLNWDRERDRR